MMWAMQLSRRLGVAFRGASSTHLNLRSTFGGAVPWRRPDHALLNRKSMQLLMKYFTLRQCHCDWWSGLSSYSSFTYSEYVLVQNFFIVKISRDSKQVNWKNYLPCLKILARVVEYLKPAVPTNSFYTTDGQARASHHNGWSKYNNFDGCD